jgi:hypothetical protein
MLYISGIHVYRSLVSFVRWFDLFFRSERTTSK